MMCYVQILAVVVLTTCKIFGSPKFLIDLLDVWLHFFFLDSFLLAVHKQIHDRRVTPFLLHSLSRAAVHSVSVC